MKKIIVVLLMCLLCACSFQARSARNFPAALHTMYFSSETPYSPLSTGLKALFRSMNVVSVTSSENARYTMHVSSDIFSYSRPETVNASLPSEIHYSQTATIMLIDNHTHKTVTKKTFSTSNALTLNANQIYTANANSLIQHELNREMVSLVYYWLISTKTKDALQHG
ncbi:MAG: hypothetical protein ACD_42C00609G0001 [uncultured bacterium]|nr:MAG: hypothetical protein ACD_42C00609G0001 [uncultured bacterium]OGT26772.1 MAG: hypothetical protein A3B71_03995 [Gammaproteobacteria bacterium RIFCSPHIGHO2_02_FULL_42_43]OGT28653.1 MAG: hypothetical protein A2624_06640 [Gammaproteobacteria bacterium RIFCSPHIGHO2_01_FULL_42_8]OGT52920.1 MAG: hypothetical protein A3E54_07530 [Gammaproteobacteria bacterium RIFCSPHIGHO2_12_FULL_41_25]OGT61306.1 MAG: hypothetical protein A3I77_08160 [Gammaproteobacteria bacterium RIFCSPLOWO2_02_FULL_42_14]OGT